MAAGLWLAGALISGFTLGRGLDVFDGGILLQAASRIAAGETLYADFSWPYGPGQPMLVAATFELFGANDLAWRVLRVASDATAALCVWWLVRPRAGARWALAAWAAAALIVAQPTTANPAPVAFALALGAAAVAVAGRPVPAGALAALAVWWRPDAGLVAGAAVLAALLVARRPRAAAVAAGTAAGLALLLYLPWVVAAGPGGLWEALAGSSAREGGFWRLPFPVLYDGPLPLWPPGELATRLKDAALYQLPLAGVVGLGAAAVALGRRPGPAGAALLVAGAGALVYLLSRSDELHAQPLLVIVSALAALGAAATAHRPLRLLLAAVLGLVLVVGAANRVSALVLAPELEPLDLPATPLVRVPPAEARALPALAGAVGRLTEPGEPIFVAPRRSDLVTLTNPLVHVLVDRPNVLRRDAFLLAPRAEQARVVAVLRARRPLVVRWTDPRSSLPEPNPRGRPSGSRALDEHLARAYELRGRYGAYDVLVPRG